MEDYGRIPPQAIDEEKAILGALMIKSDAILDIMDLLKPECFYKPAHGIIYEAICSLGKRFEPVDIITVMNELDQNKQTEMIGGKVYLVSLTDMVGSSSHIQSHAQIVYQEWIKRELIKISSEIATKCFSGIDVNEVIEYAQKTLLETTVNEIKSEPEQIGDVFSKTLVELEQKITSPDKIAIPSGFPEIKWFDSDLIILAGRSSMGKTWMGLKYVFNAAMYGNPVAMFSLEMSKSQVTYRLNGFQSGIDSYSMRDARITDEDWQKLEVAQRYFDHLPVFIDDNAGLTVFELVAKARKLKAKHDIKLIVVDYLQLLSAGVKTQTRDLEMGIISRTLKQLAKELNIPVIALSQINRGVESRADKRPLMSDLRESGNIEQDADMVIMAFRPHYYSNDPEESGIGELIIRKNRNGNLGTVKFYHNKDWTRIEANEFDFDRWSEPKQIEEYKPF